MPCDACEELNARYRASIHQLQSANAHLKIARTGTVEAAIARREVHESLRGLIAAESDLKAHRAWHIESLTALPSGAASLAV
jgi:hypothetical protein